MQKCGFVAGVKVEISILEEKTDHMLDEQLHLQTHFLLTLSHVSQLWLYHKQPSSAPWCSILLLSKSQIVRKRVIDYLQLVSNTLSALRQSPDPDHVKLNKKLKHTRWICFNELLSIYKSAGWTENLVGTMYAEALNTHLHHTYMLERFFNPMRDAEARTAKHEQTSSVHLHSLAIRQYMHDYSGVVNQRTATVTEADYTTQAATELPDSCYNNTGMDKKCGVDADALVNIALDGNRHCKGRFNNYSVLFVFRTSHARGKLQ